MRSGGIDRDIVDLAEQGWRRTREALPVLLPLLGLARPSGALPLADDEFPPVVIGQSGLPTFALDSFSWEGKTALRRFLSRDTETGRWLRNTCLLNVACQSLLVGYSGSRAGWCASG
ncbi:hypothetical protein AJ88_00885 [Mesorhizobium amorphae CCBAU 01583]|nr:hypothetical protein AJ88_00885 [Mesorhizobium amorphae CCBAU 01583]